MADILIKGMKLPKRCWDCPICYDWYECKLLEGVFEDRNDFNPVSKRPSDCPLQELPKHGDLIDRNWLIDIAIHLMRTAKNDDIANGVKWLFQYIIDAPTIIPAEEGK